MECILLKQVLSIFAETAFTSRHEYFAFRRTGWSRAHLHGQFSRLRRCNISGVVLTCPLYYPGKARKLRSKALQPLEIGIIIAH
jgi:hypothetical protein